MKIKPRISVVIPAFNCSAYIEETLNSVLAQTYQPLEVIIVNDGSTDNTLEVLESIGSDFRIVNKNNGGVSSARNVGFEHAKGDWIAFLDADDIWFPDKLELQVQAINQFPKSALIYSEFQSWFPNDDGTYSKDFDNEIVNESDIQVYSNWMYHQQLLTNWVLTSTSLIATHAIKEIGTFNENYPVAEDWDFFIRLSRIGVFTKVDCPLTLYRQSSASLTVTVKEIDYASQVIKNSIRQFGYESPNGESVDMQEFQERNFKRHFNYGLAAHKQKWHRRAARSFFESLKVKHFNIKSWLFLIINVALSVLDFKGKN